MVFILDEFNDFGFAWLVVLGWFDVLFDWAISWIFVFGSIFVVLKSGVSIVWVISLSWSLLLKIVICLLPCFNPQIISFLNFLLGFMYSHFFIESKFAHTGVTYEMRFIWRAWRTIEQTRVFLFLVDNGRLAAVRFVGLMFSLSPWGSWMSAYTSFRVAFLEQLFDLK